MELRKQCPTCGAMNEPSAFFCATCFADLSRVCEGESPDVPSEATDGKAPLPEAEGVQDNRRTVVLPEARLNLALADGRSFDVLSGDVVGREGAGSDLLASCMTVSRRHARFACENGVWFVEDAGSTNGVLVDGSRLARGERRVVRGGARIALSRECVLVAAERREPPA